MTCGNMPMPRGVTGMAQGEYWNPVKPKLMAANCD